MNDSKKEALIMDYIRRTKSYRGSLTSKDLNRLFEAMDFFDCKELGDKEEDDSRY